MFKKDVISVPALMFVCSHHLLISSFSAVPVDRSVGNSSALLLYDDLVTTAAARVERSSPSVTIR